MTRRSAFAPVPLDRRTPLTVTGRHVFGHITTSTPVRGSALSFDTFLTGRQTLAGGRTVRTGALTKYGRPVADVTVWRDAHGIGCSGLLREEGITAAAAVDQAEPWPVWELDGTTAHLVAVELDASRACAPTAADLLDFRRRRALAQIIEARQRHAPRSGAQARRR